MDILILYKSYRLLERRTTKDHLYSLSRYVGGCRFVYLDVSGTGRIPRSIRRYPFDAVIFHYLFLAYRLDRPAYRRLYEKLGPTLKQLHGVKVMIPHDEYLCTDALWELARDCGVSRIYASCYPEDYATLFPPEQVGGEDLCRTVLTGYVDDGLRRKVDRMAGLDRPRAYDVGYRALQSGYTFGLHGYMKTLVAEQFIKACEKRPDVRADIRMTSDGYRNMLTGNAWLRYLMNCRATIGCLGGSSLMDADGSLREKTRAYMAAHSNASYEEVAERCFPGQDGRIHAYLLGPKHLECAMTRTCQLLVEGDYHGVLQAGRDYIEVRRDFSNIDEVLDKLADASYCARIAENCYDDVVRSERYTYRQFACGIAEDIRALCGEGGGTHARGSGVTMLKMRLAAAAVHAANQMRNLFVNAAKSAVTALTHNNPALYERIKRMYKRG